MQHAPLEPMEARLATALPSGPGWQFEPKWDGFRCLVLRNADRVELQAKSGKSLSRYFPEVLARVRALRAKRFVLDCELAISLSGALSFSALQMRLHPAESRIRKLAAATPATLMLFDMLVSTSGECLIEKPLRVRRAALERFCASLKASY
jgi:ATP-dependent DNA ligase